MRTNLMSKYMYMILHALCDVCWRTLVQVYNYINFSSTFFSPFSGPEASTLGRLGTSPGSHSTGGIDVRQSLI